MNYLPFSLLLGLSVLLEFFAAKEVTIKNIDTEYDTIYNINRRYSRCQSGINY